LWAYAAQSYRLYAIAADIAMYGVPALLGIQTVLLGMVVWSFLRCAFTITTSDHMRSVLMNMAALCIVSLSGCLCMVALGLLLATPACYGTSCYQAVSVLYRLGQCLLFVAVFGVLWVKDNAKRTRPLFGQLELHVESGTLLPQQTAPQRSRPPPAITLSAHIP
ncbi:hypothetical protein H4R19_001542, partial [Coemansia spiralis]